MIHLAIPDLSGNERAYLNQCIDTTFVSSVGEFVNRLEREGAEICGARYGVATSAGTTGLHTALICCGVQRDELVILPSFTFIASANAVAHCGALPWLMDIEERTWTINAKQIRREIEANAELKDGKLIHIPTGRRIAAIMPVYTLGAMPDMAELRAIAQEYHLPLIADAACAIGARYRGQAFGGLADISVISLNGNKTVTAGGGGLIVGNDEKLMGLAKHITTTARVSAEYDFDMVGYNYRMTNLQAAIGCAQLERVEQLVGRKREVRGFYKTALSDLPDVTFFPDPEEQESSCWFSGIVLNEGTLNDARAICAKLKERDIEARTFWKPVHLQAPYLEAPKAEDLSVTEGLWQRIITLPCSGGITDGELETVSKALHDIMR